MASGRLPEAGSPGSGRAACAASRPGGRAPLCGAAWHPVVVLSRAFALRPPPGTGEEEAERCGGPGCETARIDSSAHLLSSSQVTARDGLPRAGRFAGSPHLLARSAHVGSVCPRALTPGRVGWRLVLCRACRGATSGGRDAVSPTWTHLGNAGRTWPCWACRTGMLPRLPGASAHPGLAGLTVISGKLPGTLWVRGPTVWGALGHT